MSTITDYIAVLNDEAEQLLEAIEDEDITRDLPSRPGQTIADAFGELAAIYRWTSRVLETGGNGEPENVQVEAETAVQQFEAARAALINDLKEHPRNSPAWTWSPVSDKAAFWHRRTAIATALARWDVQMAVGSTMPLEQPIAVVTIEEVLDSYLPTGRGLYPASVRRGLVQLFAQDADRTWFVRFSDSQIAVLDGEPSSKTVLQARVAGSASDLALALYGRLPFGIADSVGNEQLLQSLRVE